ncbi:hypothetical protein TSTA_093090 [Talaromyces stipitatus ATCC 10500]|uniref:DUF3597 domain-containing protein n=1 Tax=Talaromyces stipitatus (strain ATCC 10500 / CBS 375.48 / QM 6759 / NRRL 1006) TaxID=441959 RepID=B8LZI1_TALSN|nr:uncharacterized protein TSTA_093090 [Talaromyces stipitatus ATCC 10500]EED22063.1 hypothetical protein TSTA_093090 [Talaromyces stipitatus ATCC 10500]
MDFVLLDLFKFLNLDAGIEFRIKLAKTLNVDVGPNRSAVQNKALHQKLMDELARNNGQLPAKLYRIDEHEKLPPDLLQDVDGTQLKQSQTKNTLDTFSGGYMSEYKDGMLLEKTMEIPLLASTDRKLTKNNSTPSESDESKVLSHSSESTRDLSKSLSGIEAVDSQLAWIFLFQCSLTKVNVEKLARNVKRLIVRFGRNLEGETSEGLHKQAAKYV